MKSLFEKVLGAFKKDDEHPKRLNSETKKDNRKIVRREDVHINLNSTVVNKPINECYSVSMPVSFEKSFFGKEKEELIDAIKKKFYKEISYWKENACPYCGTVLVDRAEKDFKCKECNKKVFIRKNYYFTELLFLDSERLKEYEKYKNELATLNKINRAFEPLLWSNIISKKEFDIFCNSLNFKTNFMDYCWKYLDHVRMDCDSVLMTKIQANIDKYNIYKQFILVSSISYSMCKLLLIEERHNVFESYISRLILEDLNMEKAINDSGDNTVTGSINLLAEYLKKQKRTLDDFKTTYMTYAGHCRYNNYNFINKDKSWKYIEKQFKQYG